MSDVSLRSVTKRYGDACVVDRLDLEVGQGEFLTLLGPSGCGKTTTLRMIAGFVRPSAGQIRIGGEDVTELESRRRQVGMVFQDYALFPHLTVAENIAFGLVERRAPRESIAPRVAELLDLIQLPGLGGRTPAQLSGGQQQRVALARAIAHPPRVLLLDEPLGALDLKMREHMQVEVRRIQQQLGLTAVYVTHDQTEAMTMSDRIAVMNGGRIEQIGTPEQIYATPRTRFVASFIGKVNFARGRTQAGDGREVVVQTAAGAFHCMAGDTDVRSTAGAATATVAIRPEHLTIRAPEQRGDEPNRVEATIRSSTFCGSVRQYVAALPGGLEWLVETRAGDPVWAPGSPVRIHWQARHAVLVADPHPQDDEGVPA